MARSKITDGLDLIRGAHQDRDMKTASTSRFAFLIRNGLLGFVLVVASMACGAIPALNVTVFDGNSKVAFKSALSSSGVFSTGNLPAGDYVVQFSSRSAEPKNNSYLLVVSAGTKKVIADAVSGREFSGGGVAMKIKVGGNIEDHRASRARPDDDHRWSQDAGDRRKDLCLGEWRDRE